MGGHNLLEVMITTGFLLPLINWGADATPINDGYTNAGQNLANQFLPAGRAASAGQIGSSRHLGMIHQLG